MMYSCALFQADIPPTLPSSMAKGSGISPSSLAGESNGYGNGFSNGHAKPLNGNADRSSSKTAVAPPASLRFVDSLEAAQRRKIDCILQRLGPLGSQHTLLDIGFGWGGICIRAAELYGCKVRGITLSEEQKKLAEKRVHEQGLGDLIEFELIDYRDFASREFSKGNRFDKIVSCEMIEAVGHNHLGEFFAAIDKLLARDGVFVMQAITTPEARYVANVKSADFCNTIIFPGGCCPSLTALLQAMEGHSNLYLDQLTNFNVHYGKTLFEWRRRFNNSLEKVRAIGFDDQFVRCWNFYLCYCEVGFEYQIMNLLVLTFSRPGNGNLLPSRILNALVS